MTGERKSHASEVYAAAFMLEAVNVPEEQVDEVSHWQPVPSDAPIAAQVTRSVELPSLQDVAARRKHNYCHISDMHEWSVGL